MNVRQRQVLREASLSPNWTACRNREARRDFCILPDNQQPTEIFMSIETPTHQSSDDISPEGRVSARQDTPAQGAYDKVLPADPAGDALPLDGGLTLNDTEPQDQTETQPPDVQTLVGSEAGQTVNAAVEDARVAPGSNANEP